MTLIDRAKNIMFTPQTEWDKVNSETPNTPNIITGYVLPLTVVAAIAVFIGYGLIGVGNGFFRIKGINWGLYHAIVLFVAWLVGVFVAAFVIDILAPSFGSEKNMGRSIQLVVYSYTPMWVAAILFIIPALGVIAWIAGLYGLYLLYVGMPKLKKTPADKHVGYFVVSLLVMIIGFYVAWYILAQIMLSIFGLSYGIGGATIDIG